MSSLTVVQSESSLLHRIDDEGITVATQAFQKRDSSNDMVPHLRVVDDAYIEWLKTHTRNEQLSTSGRKNRPQRRVHAPAVPYTQSAAAAASGHCLPQRQALPTISDIGQSSAQRATETTTSFSLVGRLAAWFAAFVLVVSVGAVLGTMVSPVYSGPTETYIVQQGDTMWGLAEQSATENLDDTIATIVSINQLESSQLVPGQELELPVHPARLK